MDRVAASASVLQSRPRKRCAARRAVAPTTSSTTDRRPDRQAGSAAELQAVGDDAAERRVRIDLFAGLRPPDLHGHGRTVAPMCTVHPGQRGGSQRHVVDRAVQLADVPTQSACTTARASPTGKGVTWSCKARCASA